MLRVPGVDATMKDALAALALAGARRGRQCCGRACGRWTRRARCFWWRRTPARGDPAVADPGLVALVVLVLPYHLAQYQHHALVPAEVIALFAYAVLGRRVRIVLGAVAFLLAVCVVGMAMRAGGGSLREQIAVIEAVVSVVIAVQVWRVHRARLATITERAERAERTRRRRRAGGSPRSACGSPATCTTCSRTASP